MPRVFIAVRIDVTPVLRAAVDELSRIGGPVRAIASHNLHATLRFIGAADDDVLPVVTDAIRESVGDTPAIELRLRGLGAFPSASRPSVVWVGAVGADPLIGIVQRLNPLIDALGFTPEARPWTPHVTVARVKDRPPTRLFKLLEQHRETDFGAARVRSVDLMRSELNPKGAEYSVVDAVKLTG